MKRELMFIITVSCILSSCSTLHLGAGISFNNGNSGGCEERSGSGIQIEPSYYFGMENGPGVSLEFFTPGYTDCNDGDPLLFLIPQAKYRHFLKTNRLALDLGVGYAMGAFVDPGYNFSGGLNFYISDKLYLHLEQNYYEAFNSKENAIMPGISSNLSTQLSFGVYFN